MNRITAVLKLAPLFLITLAITGCSLDEFSSIFSDDIYDRNGDGVKDVFYEYEENWYFELVDSNFDGKIDESHKFSNDDVIIESNFDQDHDGYLETRSLYSSSFPTKQGVDLDRDGVFELIFEFEPGEVSRAVRYYERGEESNQIGRVEFFFGFPNEERLENTDMSISEFVRFYWVTDEQR